MSDSTGSGDVVDECAAGAAELVVECDAGGEGEDALEDAFFDPEQGAGAVASSVSSSLQVQKIDSIRCRIGAR